MAIEADIARPGERPTLSQIAQRYGFTVADVREGIVERGIPIKDGRIDRLDTTKAFFAAQAARDRRVEAECEHKNWYADEDREHRPVHVCEDCGGVILVSDIGRQEP